jgi:hypothetical protein
MRARPFNNECGGICSLRSFNNKLRRRDLSTTSCEGATFQQQVAKARPFNNKLRRRDPSTTSCEGATFQQQVAKARPFNKE